jgi:hypothetical protein
LKAATAAQAIKPVSFMAGIFLAQKPLVAISILTPFDS